MYTLLAGHRRYHISNQTNSRRHSLTAQRTAFVSAILWVVIAAVCKSNMTAFQSKPSVQPILQPSAPPHLSGRRRYHPSNRIDSRRHSPTCCLHVSPMCIHRSVHPSLKSSIQPTRQINWQDSLLLLQPSEQPTDHPTLPSQQPNLQPPSLLPSCQPSVHPSLQPSFKLSYLLSFSASS